MAFQGHQSDLSARPLQPGLQFDSNHPPLALKPSGESAEKMKPPAPPTEKKQITRNRASYSCLMCRKRKIRCNKVHPNCGNCSKTNEQCVYASAPTRSSSVVTESSPEEMRHGTKRRKGEPFQKESSSERTSPSSIASVVPDLTVTPSPNASIENRLDRLTQLVEALGKGAVPEVAQKVVPRFGIREEKNGSRPSSRPATTQEDLSDMLGPITARERNAAANSRDRSVERTVKSPDYDSAQSATQNSELADPFANLNIGYLSVQEGGRSRYIGSTFWAYVSDELDQLNSLLRDQNRYKSLNGNRQEDDDDDNNNNNREASPFSTGSDDSQGHGYSFHKSGDDDHHQKSQLRSDCEACVRNAFDKNVLLQSIDSHPSRFRRMSSDMLLGIPTEKQSHILFRCWLSGVHAVNPMVYPPSVLKNYERFWDWYKDGRLNGEPIPEPNYIPFLYAIWYGGSVSISLRALREFFPNVKRAALSAGFHDQIARTLTMTGFPRNGALPTLAAFLTLQIIAAREEEPTTASLFVGLALRTAQMLGLHRDPALFDFEPWEIHVRRRLWWQILTADVMIAVSSGLPPLVADGFWDVQTISELKDLNIGTPEAEQYEADVNAGKRPRDNPDDATARNRTSMVSVYNVVARGRYIMASGIRRLLKVHLGTKPVTRADMEEVRKVLAEVDHDLNKIIKRIPTKGIPEMGFTPDRGTDGHSLVADFDHHLARPPTDADLRPFWGMTPTEGLYENTIQYHWNTLVAFHKWARVILSLYIDKVYCIAYQPFLKNAKSKMWATARQCALRHCHSFMRKFISLATHPAYQPFQWSWPGSHQPMHAVMIMLVDLYERPHSTEAPRSRAFIDKTFELSGPDGGIVSGEDGVTVQRPLREGGREAWDMLRRLRDKAWQKAGLDPDVLWTEDDQVRAGIARPLSEAEKIVQSFREDAIHTSSMASGAPDGGSTMTGGHTLAGTQAFINNALDDSRSRDASASNTAAAKPAELSPELAPSPTPAPFRKTASQRPTPPQPAAVAPANTVSQPTSAGNVSSGSSATASKPVPTLPSTYPYFNPPTASSSVTQPSDSGATNPTPSENLILDIHNAPSPVFENTAGFHSQSQHTSHPRQPHHQGSIGHFDWDQWDAVFGQHVSLDDAMEENWDEGDGEHTMHYEHDDHMDEKAG